MEIYLMKKWEFDIHGFLDYADIHSKKEYNNCQDLLTRIYNYIERTCPYEYNLVQGDSILRICDAINKVL